MSYPDWTPEDRRAATHLSRLGISPAVVDRLRRWADDDGMTLRDQVRFVLGDYWPAGNVDAGGASVACELPGPDGEGLD